MNATRTCTKASLTSRASARTVSASIKQAMIEQCVEPSLEAMASATIQPDTSPVLTAGAPGLPDLLPFQPKATKVVSERKQTSASVTLSADTLARAAKTATAAENKRARASGLDYMPKAGTKMRAVYDQLCNGWSGSAVLYSLDHGWSATLDIFQRKGLPLVKASGISPVTGRRATYYALALGRFTADAESAGLSGLTWEG